MLYQSTDTLLMIKPRFFRKNEQTAINNYYQAEQGKEDAAGLAEKEFSAFADQLRENGIKVLVWDDDRGVDTPDRIFPNNWISFHPNQLVLYPMFAQNRRDERDLRIIPHVDYVSEKSHEIIDLTSFEASHQFLEGTGSLVLDRINGVAYAALSPRTHEDLVVAWCKKFNYQPVMFHAFQDHQNQRVPIYHTNVMLSIGTNFTVVCDACIDDPIEKNMLLNKISMYNRKMIRITEEQVNAFCGNILEVKNDSGKTFIVMSDTAFDGFTSDQKAELSHFGTIIHAPIQTIELLGGGSARCMLAEIF
ncbi:MAG: amidinotransferase [Flavobacteriales bacterium]|nr:amidinotransferase [Flavobacteriales bacterium]